MLRLLSHSCSFIKGTFHSFLRQPVSDDVARVSWGSSSSPKEPLMMSSWCHQGYVGGQTGPGQTGVSDIQIKNKEKWHQQVWRRKQLRRETLQNQLGEICWIRYSFFLPGNFFLELIRKLLISRQKRLLSNLYPHIKSKGCFTALLTRCQEYNSVGELLNPDGLNPEHLNTVF